MEPWLLGTIPWSIDDFSDVTNFELKLLNTPKDDWDPSAGEHTIDFGKHCNTADGFHPAHQVVGYLIKKYGNVELARAHAFGYFQIKEFMIAHAERLRRKKLVEGRDGMKFAATEQLVAALCKCPFSEECTRRGDPFRRFRFTEVGKVASKFKPG
jgi:hypothetical protein